MLVLAWRDIDISNIATIAGLNTVTGAVAGVGGRC